MQPYKKGDQIGDWHEVIDLIGAGGQGIVYLVRSRRSDSVVALKTFQDASLRDDAIREQFEREISIWIQLGRHPHIVEAFYVEKSAERLYLAMEYVPTNSEGLRSLDDYLRQDPPNLNQTLEWAIQFCSAMEYAYSQGLRCHRDIKPQNILIREEVTYKFSDFDASFEARKVDEIRKKSVKVTDFGLASINHLSGVQPIVNQTPVNFRTISGHTIEGVFGTPTHMSPEQFVNPNACDARSDIYSFGIVLYQMRTAGSLPFFVSPPANGREQDIIQFYTQMMDKHLYSAVPRLGSRLYPIIKHCLEKDPAKRYQAFCEVRADLEKIADSAGSSVVVTEATPNKSDPEFWNNKGFSLAALGKPEEAIACLDRALELDPANEGAWCNKANTLEQLGRYDDSIQCSEMALQLNPQSHVPWLFKGIALEGKRNWVEAIRCYDEAIRISPDSDRPWFHRGSVLSSLGRHDEAVYCYDRALGLNCKSVNVWMLKATSLYALKRFVEAGEALDHVVSLDPRHGGGWRLKGGVHSKLKQPDDAIYCYDRALEVDPSNKRTWFLKAAILHSKRDFNQAISCCDRLLQIDSKYVIAWYIKGLAWEDQGQKRMAISCFEQFINNAPPEESSQTLTDARQRLRRLSGRTWGFKW